MPAGVDSDRLERLLGRDEMRWLVSRVRLRLERGQALTGSVSVPNPTPQQRRAVEVLLGRPPGTGRSLTVSLADVDLVLRRSGAHPDGLAGAVVALAGPVRVAADEQAAREMAWQAALAPLDVAVAGRPELAPWYSVVRARGLLRRLCRTPEVAAPVAAAAARVLAVLPVANLPLGQLAATAAGDAHALDQGRPLATVVLSAVRHTWWVGDLTQVTPAQRRRALWDCVGVILDELSSTVLVLNLSAPRPSGLGTILEAARADGQPLVLTLRQLTAAATAFAAGDVFVCENPSVVLAAADRLGTHCRPLVCVSGQPTTAAMHLLDRLARCGASLSYHGDFDWGGIRIANLLWARLPMRSWRFDVDSYRRVVRPDGRALTGSPVAAIWDGELAPAMRAHGRRVEEEAVLHDLLTDLAQPLGVAIDSPLTA